MGCSAEPLLAFGFPIGPEDEIEIEGFATLVEAVDDGEDEGWPVQFVRHGHYEYRYWFLAIPGAVDCGNGYGDALEVPTREMDAGRIKAAKAWCQEHDIPWRKPAWFALATYG